MRVIILLASVACIRGAAPAQTIEWESIVRISTGTLDDYTPEVFASGDTIHVFWVGSSGCCDAKYARSIDGGMTFTPETTLIAAGVSGSWITPEGMAFGASGGAAYVMTTEFFDDGVTPLQRFPSFKRSTSGGTAWDSLARIPGTPGSLFLEPGTHSVHGDRIAQIYLDQNVSDSIRFGIVASTDGGDSWLPRRGIPAGDVPAQLAINSYGVHFFGTINFEDSDEMLFLRSSDMGVSWSDSTVLSQPLYSSDEPAIAATDDGHLYAVWRDDMYGITCKGFHASILMRRSTDDGASWEAEQVLTGTSASGNQPTVAVHGSRVAVAWEDCQEETEGPPVVTLSLDRGLEWSEPVPFDDFGGTISLALQDSFVHVVWEKMETVPGSGWDVWYRRGRIQITTDIVDVPGPTGRVLLQNYPNPFNPSTTITFEMPRGDDVTLTIYDLLGRELGRLADGIYPPGRHQVEWNADGLPGGVYYCRLQAGDVVRTKELVLMR